MKLIYLLILFLTSGLPYIHAQTTPKPDSAKPATKTIQEVTVITGRLPIEYKPDRMIVNVAASPTNAGATAMEVLERSPGVSVDKDGNISLKGKDGVLVLIDGRPTQLSGTDLANLLRNMSSVQIDVIEIMTNPPARYDAEGNAGIIHIKTKKSKKAGYSGSATLGYMQGVYPKVNEGLQLSYRSPKLSVYANLSHAYREAFSTLSIQRNLRHSQTGTLEQTFDQVSQTKRLGHWYNGKAGIDYSLNPTTTIGAVVSGYSSSQDRDGRNRTRIATPSGELQSTTLSSAVNTSGWTNLSVNGNFRKTFDSAGRELTADVDYSAYDAGTSQYLINDYFDASGYTLGKGDTVTGSLPQQIRIRSGRIDYVHPLKKGAKLEAGLKSSIVGTDNDAGYDSIQYGQVIHDRSRSNHFTYEETIHAAYINGSAPLSAKLSAQIGLRYEDTRAKGHQLTTGETFDRHYAQLFPTAYLQYKADDKRTFGLNYGRRIRRPDYESLNPFIRFMDRYTYNQGNPELKPQLSHNIELTHNWRNIITTTLNYTVTRDIIQRVIEQKGQEAYAREANIATMHQYGLAVSFQKQVNKWWMSSIYANGYYNSYTGVVNGTQVSLSGLNLSLHSTQQFKLSKTLTAELSGFYRSAGQYGVITMQPRGALSVALSQQVLQQKGSIQLGIRDLFYTQGTSARAYYGNVDAAFQELNDSRVVSLTFNYRFSKGKVNGQKKRTGGSAGEEQNRVGVE